MKSRNCNTSLCALARLTLPLFLVSLAAPAFAQVASVAIVISTPNPVVQGQSVTFTAGVNATASAYPTGTITLTDSCTGASGPTVTTLGTIALASSTSPNPGSGTLTINTFPCTGANTIVAQYSGDANYTAGTSAPLIETVLTQFTPATVTLGSSSNPVPVGQPITFNAVLTFTPTQNSNATGTVTFTDTNTGTVIGTGTVQTAGGARLLTTYATYTTSSLAAGSYAVQASYSGDNIYGPSTSQILNEVVQPSGVISTTTALSSLQTSVTLGSAVSFTAQVSSASGIPGGNVTFLDGTAVLGSVNLDANGQAALTTSSLAQGPHSVTANYGGSVQFAGSTSNAVSITVQPVVLTATTTTLAASTNPATAGVAFALSATVTAAGNGTPAGAPTGTVTFQDNSSSPAVVLGTATVQNGIATVNPSLAAGTRQLSANYSGDSNFAASTGNLSEAVNPPSLPATATAVKSSADPSTFGQAVTFTASVTGTVGTVPTGSVMFSIGSMSSVVGLDTFGNAVLTTSAVPTGSANVSAAYSGDVSNAGSASPVLVQTVTQGSTATSLKSSLNPSAASTNVTFTATVTAVAPASGTPTGNVTFVADGSTVVCSTVTVHPDGTAICPVSTLPVGAHTVVATYNGDSNFLTSTVSVTQNVTAGPPANQLSVSGTGFTYSPATKLFYGTLTVTNSGAQAVSGPITVLFNGLPAGVSLVNAVGMMNGVPFITLPQTIGASQSANFNVQFSDPGLVNISYAVSFQ